MSSTIGIKRGLEDDLENTSSSEPLKAARPDKKVVIRRNIVELAKNKPEELKRFLIALSRMQRNAERDPKSDWWNICAIHGGPFRYEVESSMRPAYKQYLEYYGPVQQKDKTADRDWQTTGFCAHNIPTFLVWHRPYMKAFELALQHYDPKPDEKVPLALHYWEWDSASSHALPKIFTDKTIKDYNGNDIDNPLLLGPTGITALTNPPYTQRGKYPGVPLAQLDSGYNAFHAVNDYSKICTANDNPYNFESPHNQLHNAVGGDMADVSVAAFDPIFWLHHSNVERMHSAWIRKHGIPEHVIGYHKKIPNHDYIDAPLYPFPPMKSLRYDTLPWKVNNTDRTTWSTPREWLKETANYYPNKKGEVLDYMYDNLEDICVPNTSLPTILTLEEKTEASRTSALEKMFIYLDDVQASGSGTLYVEVTITAGDQPGIEAFLDPRPVFAREQTECPNCAANSVSYSWIVWISHAALGYPDKFRVLRGQAVTEGPESQVVLLNIEPSANRRQIKISAKAYFVEKDENGNNIDGVPVQFSGVQLRKKERPKSEKKSRQELTFIAESLLQG